MRGLRRQQGPQGGRGRGQLPVQPPRPTLSQPLSHTASKQIKQPSPPKQYHPPEIVLTKRKNENKLRAEPDVQSAGKSKADYAAPSATAGPPGRPGSGPTSGSPPQDPSLEGRLHHRFHPCAAAARRIPPEGTRGSLHPPPKLNFHI